MNCQLCPTALRCIHNLANLLPAGVLEICLESVAFSDVAPSQVLWNALDISFLIQNALNPNDEGICRQLEFLVQHHFAVISCCLCALRKSAILRVYLMPFDLPGVHGRLRLRKEEILSPARKYLRYLLPLVIQDAELWNGGFNQRPMEGNALLPRISDPRTPAEIYGDIASPVASPWADCPRMIHRLLDPRDNLQGLGIKSELFGYQRETVAAMLKKELDQRDIPDPLFVPIVGLDSTTFYLQPAKMEILMERPQVSSTRGGILCEELGTGKTVMTLSLIVLTLHELPSPEPSIVDPHRPILTPVAFRHFANPDYQLARQRARVKKTSLPVPSLVELLLHHARLHPTRDTKWRERFEETRLWPWYQQNIPFYHHYPLHLADLQRKKRNHTMPGPKTMFLTSASLVVVPTNLVSQWMTEINKHCAIPIRILTVRRRDPLPSARVLATEYDIVLLSYDKLSQEAVRGDPFRLYTWDQCQCLDNTPELRIPICTCQEDTTISPLLQIRWKRLVIDEGHVSGTVSNNLNHMAKLLSVERKWVVTGTPTTHLLGLSFGSNSAEECEDIRSDGDLTPEPPSLLSNTAPLIRVWTRSDAQDLNKLATMMAHFIAVPMFNSDTKRFYTHVASGLMERAGPAPGAVQVLTQVMEMVMIRHRIEDVEKDVVLPPIRQETVLMDLDVYALRSYNALQASIAINAIDSERKDQDYLFHPRNAESLQELVQNISQVLFYGISSNLYNTAELAPKMDEYIQRSMDRGASQEDLDLIRSAFEQIQIAASDSSWKETHVHEDIPYRVYSLDEAIFRAWTRTMPAPATYPYSGMIHCDRLLRMRDDVVGRPLMTKEDLILRGRAVAEHEAIVRAALQAKPERKKAQQSPGKRKNSGAGGEAGKPDTRTDVDENAMDTSPSTNDDDELPYVSRAPLSSTETKPEIPAPAVAQDQGTLRSSLLAGSSVKHSALAAAKSHVGQAKVHEVDRELQIALEKQEVLEASESSDTLQSSVTNTMKNSENDSSVLLRSSLLAGVQVGSSASSKLDYILNEIMEHSPSEKFLVFSDSPLTLAHLAEGLDMIQVKYLRFSTQIHPQVREHFVMTFETSETYRVFLMELKHGARGLNLTSASRIIFCEPVWRADVESQAIKRAHRIGQTRPISVKTLAIRGTHEEKMLSRREALRSLETIPNITNETGMRHFIANPQFLKRHREAVSAPGISLLKVPDPISRTSVEQNALDSVGGPSVPLEPSVSIEYEVTIPGRENADAMDGSEEPPAKKRRVVTFAT